MSTPTQETPEKIAERIIKLWRMQDQMPFLEQQASLESQITTAIQAERERAEKSERDLAEAEEIIEPLMRGWFEAEKRYAHSGAAATWFETMPGDWPYNTGRCPATMDEYRNAAKWLERRRAAKISVGLVSG